MQLFGYIQRIYSLSYEHRGTFFWRLYDEEFRRYKAGKIDLEWNELNASTLQAVKEMLLHQEARVLDSKSTSQAQPSQASGQGQSQKKMKLPINGTCLHWNKKMCKSGSNCKWKHLCCHCFSKDHKAPACPNKP